MGGNHRRCRAGAFNGAKEGTLVAGSTMAGNASLPREQLLAFLDAATTEEQKNHYLPRLAKGLEIPLFALTSPHAGSDAASIPDVGIVCRGMWEGTRGARHARHLGQALHHARARGDLLGLAFRLRDPEHLLGDNEDLGITCALIPTETPGVNIGRRHLPLNAAFLNGPNSGKDVFMPLDWIIGGPKMAGPGLAHADGVPGRRPLDFAAVLRRAASASSPCAPPAPMRASASQFGTPIGRFEGVEEALARIGGNLYLMDAARVMTAGAVDLGEKPSVISAIVQVPHHRARAPCVNDAMDVHGGKGICLGPQQLPGARLPAAADRHHRGGRQHPHAQPDHLRPGRDPLPSVRAEGDARDARATREGLARFRRALFGHIGSRGVQRGARVRAWR